MKTNHPLIVLVLSAGLLISGCSTEAAAAPTVPEGARVGELIELEECEFQPPASKANYAAECGTLIVPESWDAAASRPIALPVLVQVSDPGDGTLLWTTPWGEWGFVEVEPNYFRQVDGNFSIAFREDDQGRITHLFSDLAPMYTFERLAWYETAGFNMALLAGCTLIFLSMIAAASIGAIRNRRRSGDPKTEPRGARSAQWIILGICVLNLLFVVGSFLWNNPKPMFGVSIAFQFVLGLGVLSAVLTIGALVYTALAWKNSYWGIASRAYYTLVTVAALAFVWFLNYWNLLGWRF
jgi:hypothetical protein